MGPPGTENCPICVSPIVKRYPSIFLALAIGALSFLTTTAQSQMRMMGVQPKGFMLLVPAVQKELNLTAGQITKIKNVFGDTVTTDSEGRLRVQLTGGEDMDEMNKEAQKVVNADQAKRLHEVWLQRVGIRAVSDKGVQKDLKLSADQLKRIDAAMEDFNEDVQALIHENNGRLTPEVMAGATKKLEKTIKNILTTEQSKSLEDMKGKPFKFDK